MCLSIEQYKEEIDGFLKLSEKNHDAWCVYPCESSSSPVVQKHIVESFNEHDKTCLINMSFFIHYSESYSVPVLSFQATFIESGNRVPLKILWQYLQKRFENAKHITNEDLWSFVSENYHQVLQIPVFQFHPCKTQEIMKNALLVSNEKEKFSYLISWLSTVGSMVGLFLDINIYACPKP